jgi:HD domain
VAAVADTLAETDLERRFLAKLREASGEVDGAMERHCVRCFLFMDRLAERRGVQIDRELALCAALVHDIGLYDSVSGGGVYTDEGGALAARLFTEAGQSGARARLIEDACAQHHALRDQSDRGTEVELLRLADRIELSGGVLKCGLSRDDVQGVFDRVSRAGTYRVIAGLVGHALVERPLTLPRIFKAG